MEYLTFQDLLRKNNFSINDFLLIRHSKSDLKCRWHIQNNYMLEYTAVQKSSFPTQYKYIATFVSGEKNSAILDCIYEIVGFSNKAMDFLSPQYFILKPDLRSEENLIFFNLSQTDILIDYNKKLVIDWGNSARSWYQKALHEKNILSIHPIKSKEFSGYEDFVLSYEELSEIINDEILYSDWHSALKSINAIYSIVDKRNGKIYIGSSYGTDGLLGRWRCYVKTGHGNNKQLVELLKINENDKSHFQFTIMQVLSKNITANEVIYIESSYKNKLLTIDFGLNSN